MKDKAICVYVCATICVYNRKLYIYICIYIYVCVCICMYMYVYIYIYIYICICICIYIYTYILVYVFAYIYIYIWNILWFHCQLPSQGETSAFTVTTPTPQALALIKVLELKTFVEIGRKEALQCAIQTLDVQHWCRHWHLRIVNNMVRPHRHFEFTEPQLKKGKGTKASSDSLVAQRTSVCVYIFKWLTIVNICIYIYMYALLSSPQIQNEIGCPTQTQQYCLVVSTPKSLGIIILFRGQNIGGFLYDNIITRAKRPTNHVYLSGGQNYLLHSQWTWPKWVVPYRLWRVSQKSEHPKSTPYQFSLRLILSATHMSYVFPTVFFVSCKNESPNKPTWSTHVFPYYRAAHMVQA